MDVAERGLFSVSPCLSNVTPHLVKEAVGCPGEKEADPANGYHDPHLTRGQGVWDSVDVNQLHVGPHAHLRGDGDAYKQNRC